MSKDGARAEVHSYWPEPHPPFEETLRVGASIWFGENEEVRLVTRFPGPTVQGEGRSQKYRREYGEIIEALNRTVPEFCDGVWRLPYKGKEAVFDAVRLDGSRRASEDMEKLDFGAVKRALEEICSTLGRIKVSELSDRER